MLYNDILVKKIVSEHFGPTPNAHRCRTGKPNCNLFCPVRYQLCFNDVFDCNLDMGDIEATNNNGADNNDAVWDSIQFIIFIIKSTSAHVLGLDQTVYR